MKTFSLLISIASLASIALAADPTPPKTAIPAPKEPVPVKIEVKNKSSFAADAGSRNPFWPIGWKPAGKLSGGGGVEQAGEIPVTAFVLSTITVDEGGRFAIINGKTMQEGQQFGLLLGAQTYQISVKKIEDGRVILSRHGEEIVIPLRRK